MFWAGKILTVHYTTKITVRFLSPLKKFLSPVPLLYSDRAMILIGH